MTVLAKIKAGHWDHRIPWLFLGFFLTIFLANAVMVTVALRTWSGLTTEHAFEEGLAHNDRLAERARQSDLGWRVAAGVEILGAGDTELRVRLAGPTGRPLFAEDVQARLQRPTLEGHDFVLTLVSRGDGLYSAPADFPLPGQWDLELEVRKGDDLHVSRRRLYLAP